MIKQLHRKNWLHSPVFWLGLITLLAGWLRFYKLGLVPAAFAFDEAGLAYNGWSLWLTGRDEWGELLPLTMRSFDDWKPAIYAYLTIPGIALFGLNETTARLPAAIFGTLLPAVTFFLFRRVSKDNVYALLTATMVALSPWHVEVSRTAIEAGVALTMSMLATYLLLGKSRRTISWGFGLLSLSLFTYHTARLITPVIPMIALIIGVLDKKSRPWWRWQLWPKFRTISLLLLFVLGLSSRLPRPPPASNKSVFFPIWERACAELPTFRR